MRLRWLADSVPPVFGGLAEAGWIGVYAAAVGAPATGAGPSGNLGLVVLAALTGVAASRLLPFNLLRPAAILVLALLAVAAGTLISEAAGLVSTSALRLATEMLLGLAVLRGAAAGNPDAGPRAIDGVVRLSPALVGGGWLLGLWLAGEARAEFVDAAFVATILFIVAAAIGLGTARLQALAADAHLPGTNRAWLALVGLVVGSVVLVALPVASLIGLPFARGVATVLIGIPIGFAGSIIGAIGTVAATVAAILVALLQSVVGTPSALPAPSRPAGAPQPLPIPTHGADASAELFRLLLGASLIAVLIGLAVYLAYRWQGRRRTPRRVIDVPERRSIAFDPSAIGLPALGITARLRAPRPPRDALQAYPRLMDDWSAPHPWARRPSETPAAHARRLRQEGEGDLGLDLLVADYELARFGGVRLTAPEDRRAVARWGRLRARHAPEPLPPSDDVRGRAGD
jgi:Domain of unknown function (DUF4129)